MVLGNTEGGRIIGSITDNQGITIENASVRIDFKDGENWHAAGYTTADSNGDYQFNKLPPNHYRLYFYGGNGDSSLLSEYYNNAYKPEQASIIELTANDEIIANAQLDKRPSLTGTVTDTTGQPLENASVELYLFNDKVGFSSYASTTTNSSGQYSFNNEYYYLLEVERPYKIKFTSDTLGSEFYNDVAYLQTATAIELSPNEEAIIDIVLGT